MMIIIGEKFPSSLKITYLNEILKLPYNSVVSRNQGMTLLAFKCHAQ